MKKIRTMVICGVAASLFSACNASLYQMAGSAADPHQQQAAPGPQPDKSGVSPR